MRTGICPGCRRRRILVLVRKPSTEGLLDPGHYVVRTHGCGQGLPPAHMKNLLVIRITSMLRA